MVQETKTPLRIAIISSVFTASKKGKGNRAVSDNWRISANFKRLFDKVSLAKEDEDGRVTRGLFAGKVKTYYC